ncbi:MAG: hypothetical protein NT163_06570 [Chlorobiales bacterium]|jgi:hypothetical protein|nr:hypothetical protein [Chlorobiales bacterium]
MMNVLIEKIQQAHWADRVVTEGQLARILDGTPQRRYNLVNRALHRGELLHLRRGLYLLSSAKRDRKVHPFVLAQSLLPGSYVSFETALSFHGWIPESTPVTMGVTPGIRRQAMDVKEFGLFRFYPLALCAGYFLESVDRQVFVGQSALVAQPLRALLDIVCLRKVDVSGIMAFIESMRIDADLLAQIEDEELQRMLFVYKHKRVSSCILALQRELKA